MAHDAIERIGIGLGTPHRPGNRVAILRHIDAAVVKPGGLVEPVDVVAVAIGGAAAQPFAQVVVAKPRVGARILDRVQIFVEAMGLVVTHGVGGARRGANSGGDGGGNGKQWRQAKARHGRSLCR